VAQLLSVRMIFLFWLSYDRIPLRGQTDGLPFSQDKEYQFLLAEIYCLAHDRRIPKMMVSVLTNLNSKTHADRAKNDVMIDFIGTLPFTELNAERLQKMLRGIAGPSGTILRMAICEEIIYLELHDKTSLAIMISPLVVDCKSSCFIIMLDHPTPTTGNQSRSRLPLRPNGHSGALRTEVRLRTHGRQRRGGRGRRLCPRHGARVCRAAASHERPQSSRSPGESILLL
jgi:hypothetical protein